MRLTPTELDRLTIFTAAELARRRRTKGWKLNHPEALAIICDEMHEAARGGASYQEVVRVGQSVLGTSDVAEGGGGGASVPGGGRGGQGVLNPRGLLEGLAEMVGTSQIECPVSDGMRV